MSGAPARNVFFPLSADGLTPLAQDAQVRKSLWDDVLNLTLWRQGTTLDDITLQVHGTGEATVEICGASADPDAAPMVIAKQTGRLPMDIALPADTQAHLVWPQLHAHVETTVTQIGWATATPAAQPVKLALVVTTFAREAAAQKAIETLTALIDTHLSKYDAHLFVIDNGATLEVAPRAHLTCISNPNLGGAGGFARGLAQAKAQGFTHCLFMDDDAATPALAIRRAHAFLQWARTPNAAITGAMVTQSGADGAQTMWEYGARFDTQCRPLGHDTPLDTAHAARHLERDNTGPLPQGHYGGWWCFAFPIAAVTHWPFPYFVRGDDSAFCLSNDFSLWRISGVASCQDSFDVKSSPLTAYLDMRYHLIHGLVFAQLGTSRWQAARTTVRLILRNLMVLRYDSAKAQLMAWQDVLGGPAFLLDDPAAQAPRARVKALTTSEIWTPRTHDEPPRHLPEDSRLRRVLILLTLNGFLLPLSALLGKHRVIAAAQRGRLSSGFCTKTLRVINAADNTQMTLAPRKATMARLILRMAPLALRWVVAHRKNTRRYRAAFTAATTPAYWADHFGKDIT